MTKDVTTNSTTMEKYESTGEKTEYSSDPIKTDDIIDRTEEGQNADNGLAGGDAALANAAWQFKMIALITALMLPGTVLFIFTTISCLIIYLQNYY